MLKKSEELQSVPSWYPSPNDVLNTQRQQMAASKKAAADFASHAFRRSSTPWWRRIFRSN